jgi:hypothetical protein
MVKLRLLISLIALVFLGIVITFAYSVIAQWREPSPIVLPPVKVIKDVVISNQPRLQIDTEDLKRNGKPITIKYYVFQEGDTTYYTYIYTWEFSDTPWYFNMLGYVDHDWDYEPVIVAINNNTSEIRYVYDAGHYRAGITNSGSLLIQKDIHDFIPSEIPSSSVIQKENFEEITTQQLASMNKQISAIPRLPFGKALGLTWACINPGMVIEKHYFSGDHESSFVPVETTCLGGLLAGISLVLLLQGIGLIIRRSTLISFGFSLCIGIVSGLVGGMIGGFLNYVFPITASNESIFVVTILAVLVSGVLGYTFCKFVFRKVTKEILLFGILCSISAGLLTSLW